MLGEQLVHILGLQRLCLDLRRTASRKCSSAGHCSLAAMGRCMGESLPNSLTSTSHPHPGTRCQLQVGTVSGMNRRFKTTELAPSVLKHFHDPKTQASLTGTASSCNRLRLRFHTDALLWLSHKPWYRSGEGAEEWVVGFFGFHLAVVSLYTLTDPGLEFCLQSTGFKGMCYHTTPGQEQI